MKKMMALILGLALLLCAASAPAEGTEKIKIGTISTNGAFTLQCSVPEGYSSTPLMATRDQVICLVSSENPAAPSMTLSVAFDEKYWDVDRMNDLSPEELTLLEETYIMDDPAVEITYRETGYGTRLLMARHDTETQDYLGFFSIYKGYCVEFVLHASETAEDKNLTEDQIQLCIDFLTELDFVPVTLAEGEKGDVAGQMLLTNLSEYDPENGTVRAVVVAPVSLDPDTMETLQPGDTLPIGEEPVVVDTVEKADDYVQVNGNIILAYAGNEVHAYVDDRAVMRTVADLRLSIPEDLVFVDDIDPATGDLVDDPAEQTAADFIALLAEGGSPDFASENVYVTYDENGDMVQVERVYTEWQ